MNEAYGSKVLRGRKDSCVGVKTRCAASVWACACAVRGQFIGIAVDFPVQRDTLPPMPIFRKR